jgi:hypothetical protein
MSNTRRFLLAPSLARLIEKEWGGHRIRQGYFAEQTVIRELARSLRPKHR